MAISKQALQSVRRLSDRVRDHDNRIARYADRRNPSATTPVCTVRITGFHSDSPPTGEPLFVGNLYARGLAAGVTTYGVTVRIPQATQNTPATVDWDTVPACIGLRVTETWTGAMETHANDTVYYAFGLLLLGGDA